MKTEPNPLMTLTGPQLHALADLKELFERLQSPLREIVAGIVQPSSNGNGKPKRTWTAARRRKFMATMRARRKGR